MIRERRFDISRVSNNLHTCALFPLIVNTMHSISFANVSEWKYGLLKGWRKRIGMQCPYVQSYGLLGPGLLHLVIHDGVVDAQSAKDHKGLRRAHKAEILFKLFELAHWMLKKRYREANVILQRDAGRHHRTVAHRACSALGRHLLHKPHNKSFTGMFSV